MMGIWLEKCTHAMGKVWVTNFPGFPLGFVTFSCAMTNWWENPCISHVMKDTTGWKSNGTKAPIPWENCEYQFPRSSPYNGFCCIFLYYGKLMGKPMHFPYDEVYHRMGIRWEKNTHTMGKVWVPTSQVLSIRRVLLHFPMLWEIDRKTHVFAIWWSIPQDGNQMGKKYPYYGKSMGNNFPGSPNMMGFVAFSHVMGNWWENPCTSHTMIFINFFLCKARYLTWNSLKPKFVKKTSMPNSVENLGYIKCSSQVAPDLLKVLAILPDTTVRRLAVD